MHIGPGISCAGIVGNQPSAYWSAGGL